MVYERPLNRAIPAEAARARQLYGDRQRASTADVGGYWQWESDHIDIPIDSRGNVVRVNLVDDKQGVRRIHIREWFEMRDGTKRPTRYGGAWPVEIIDDLLEAIKKISQLEV